jgi:hypothetical protein
VAPLLRCDTTTLLYPSREHGSETIIIQQARQLSSTNKSSG